jgi:RND family efflux transporter MFP subunit
MSKKELLLKRILPVAILLTGVLITIVMIKMRSTPERVTRTYSGPLVEVMIVESQEMQIVVPGTGTAQATQLADITPQVSGKVKTISSRMVDGGFFNKGEFLFSIEKIDYELALERAKASLAQAELELMRNQSMAEIAQLEWERIDQQKDGQRQANPLTLYEPQMKAAEAQVASAESVVRQSELDLSRTVMRAPFNCYVKKEQIDVGQYVRAGTPVATVAGTDAVEIVVPMQLEELSWLQVPRNGKSAKGSLATVRMQIGEDIYNWPGRIIRSFGEIDPRTRMAKVIVAVEDPFGKKAKDIEHRPELAPGMFVEVLMHGTELENVIVIPRGALRDNDTVWTVDENDKLQIRQVEIIRREEKTVLVSSGLNEGDKVILTGLAAAADGMLLRPQLLEAD